MLTPADRLSARLRPAAGLAVLVGCLLVAGCGASEPTTTSSPSSAAPTPSAAATPTMTPTPTPAPTPGPSSPTPAPSSPETDEVVIDITIADDTVSPSGEKVDVERGQTVVLNVSSDIDDELHAHTGGDGYELEVKAGEQTSGSFVAANRGSFEVESHHLDKIIVILNVR